VNALSLAPLATLHGDVLLAVAARVGPVRLIDNERIQIS
jgi:pantothenate synthetase